MRRFQLSEIASPLQGELMGVDAAFDAVVTDSRLVEQGALFVALRGENFDAHAFLGDVAARGAAGAVVSRAEEYPLPMLRVRDTREALGDIGALNRQHFDGALVAITGSSGKTSVKNLLAAVLSQAGPTLSTLGNFNNEIGVPLTLLRLEPEHRFAVVEMGAAGAGHIGYLCELARPTVSVLLNAMPAHLQGFGSVDAVAEAKGEIFTGLQGRGVAVINADSEYAARWRELAGQSQVLEFGLATGAAVTAHDCVLDDDGCAAFTLHTPVGEVPVQLHLPGMHSVMNALAAAAAALALDLDLAQIAAGLESVHPVAGRMRPVELPSGARLIDDSYNANPGSVSAAIEVLAALPGRRLLVLGEMAELGADSERYHAEVGQRARSAGIDALLTVGGATAPAVSAFGEGATRFDDRQALLEALAPQLGADHVVLVKGSRSAGMDAVVTALSAATAGEG